MIDFSKSSAAIKGAILKGIRRLGGESAEAKVVELAKGTKESIATAFTEGESMAQAEAKPITEKAIEETTKASAKTFEKVYEKVDAAMESRIQEKVNAFAPDIVKYAEQIAETKLEGGQTGKYVDRIFSKLDRFGIKYDREVIQEAVNAEDTTGKSIYSAVASQLKEHARRQVYKQAVDDLNLRMAKITKPEIAEKSITDALKKQGVEFADGESLSAALDKLGELSGKQLRAVMKDTYQSVTMAKKIQLDRVDRMFDVSPLARAMDTQKDYINRFYVFAQKNNMPDVAAKLAQLHEHVNVSARIDARSKSLGAALDAELSKYDVETQRKMRTYVQNIDTARIEKGYSTGIFNDGIEFDRNAAIMTGIIDEQGNSLVNGIEAKDIFRTTVRVQNSMRAMRRTESLLDTPDADEQDMLPNNATDLFSATGNKNVAGEKGNFSSDFLWKDYNFSRSSEDMGDLGFTYTHIKLTPEHREYVVKAKMAGGFGDHVSEQSAYQKMRRDDSLARLDENRLSWQEEIASYFGEYTYANAKRRGNSLIDEIESMLTVNDALGLMKSEARGDFRAVTKNIRQSFNDAFVATKDPYANNAFTAAVAFLTDTATTAVLSPLNVKNIAFNLMQDVQTTLSYKPAKDVLAAQSIFSEYGKYLAKGEKNLFTRLHGMSAPEDLVRYFRENLKNKMVRDSIDHYFSRYAPDIIMGDMYSDNKRLAKIVNLSTILFQTSDVLSRVKALMAATSFAEREYAAYMKEGLSAKEYSIAKGKMIDALHLHEFHAIDMERLLSKINNKEKFIKEFAALSVDSEMFNYNRFNKAKFIENARVFHPITARMTRFISWNMYYMGLLRGAMKSYHAGDQRPLKAMAIMGSAWMVGMSAASGVDDESIHAIAQYGLSRTPLFSPTIGLVTQGMGDAYGIASPAISALALPLLFGTKEITNMFGSDKSQFDYMYNDALKNVKAHPVMKYSKDIIDFLEE